MSKVTLHSKWRQHLIEVVTESSPDEDYYDTVLFCIRTGSDQALAAMRLGKDFSVIPESQQHTQTVMMVERLLKHLGHEVVVEVQT